MKKKELFDLVEEKVQPICDFVKSNKGLSLIVMVRDEARGETFLRAVGKPTSVVDAYISFEKSKTGQDVFRKAAKYTLKNLQDSLDDE